VAKQDELKTVMNSLTDPINHDVVRFASPYASENTGAAVPWGKWPISVGSSTSTGQQLPAGTVFAAAFRDPLCNSITYAANPAHLMTRYDAYWFSPTTDDQEIPAFANDITLWEEDTLIDFAYWECNSTSEWQPHGPIQYVGFDDKTGRKAIWIDAGSVFTVTATTNPWATTFYLDKWTPQTIEHGKYNVILPVAAEFPLLTYAKKGLLTLEDPKAFCDICGSQAKYLYDPRLLCRTILPTHKHKTVTTDGQNPSQKKVRPGFDDLPSDLLGCPFNPNKFNECDLCESCLIEVLTPRAGLSKSSPSRDCHTPLRVGDIHGDGSRPKKSVRESDMYIPMVSTTVTVTESGYYSVRIHNVETTEYEISGLSMYWTASDSHFCHNSIYKYDEMLAVAPSIRVLAQSIMCTNTAAPIYRGGQISAYQSPGNTAWTNYVDIPDAVSSANKSYTIDIVNGLYAWLRPTQPTDFDYMRDIDMLSKTLVDSYFPLRPRSAYIVIRGVVSDPDNFSGIWTLCSAVEYETANTWIDVDPPECNSGVYLAALDALKDIPQFSENAFHIAKLVKSAANVANRIVAGVNRYAPLIGAATRFAETFI